MAYPALSERKSVPENRVKSLYESCLVTPLNDIEEPSVVFQVDCQKNGLIKVGTKGNISMLKGAQKSRKTFAISAIAAAVAGMVQAVAFKSSLDSAGKVLFVDTEQGLYDCKKVLRRVLTISGHAQHNYLDHVIFLSLRSHSPEIRRNIIEYALQQQGKDIDLVIIDGIRDLITDINDSSESTEIVTTLMAWSSKYDIHITNILHENKSNQNARGHIGTELQNKCESVMRVSKVENNDEYSAIEAEYMRGLSFEPFLFYIDDEGIPKLDMEAEIEKKQPSKANKQKASVSPMIIPDDTHINAIRRVFANEMGMFDNVTPLSSREFHRRLKKHMNELGHKISDHKARDFTSWYLDKRLLIDSNEENHTTAKKLIPGFDDEIPF